MPGASAPACHRPDPRLALPRRPETTALHAVVAGHVRTFLARAEERGGVPRFVQRELLRFLECGIPAHGFVRVHCAGCGHDRLVAFSCKGRGFCPSCGGRRMAESAAHLVDRVLPAVPVRQWVLSLPFGLRYALAREHALLTAVLQVVMRAVLGIQRDRARALGAEGKCGAVTAVQRFGGALNLNVHFHVIVLDGVHVMGKDGRVRFQALPAPTGKERRAWTEEIASRVARLLRRRGLLAGDDGQATCDEAPSALEACQAASVRNVVAMGPRAGRPLRKIVLPGLARDEGRGTHEASGAAGFDLHIGPVVRADERGRLERLCRYLLRPPLASERLEVLPDGRVKYSLRHAWRDGTTAVVMDPLDFVGRLAALVPAPGRHEVRYHGTLAPNAGWRKLIVPKAPEAEPRGGCGGEGNKPAAQGSSRIAWADLIKRVFAVDVLKCPRCHGRMRIIATVTEPKAVRQILECIGLPARPPPVAPASAREQAELGFEG